MTKYTLGFYINIKGFPYVVTYRKKQNFELRDDIFVIALEEIIVPESMWE